MLPEKSRLLSNKFNVFFTRAPSSRALVRAPRQTNTAPMNAHDEPQMPGYTTRRGYLDPMGIPWDSEPSSGRGGEEIAVAVALSSPSGDRK